MVPCPTQRRRDDVLFELTGDREQELLDVGDGHHVPRRDVDRLTDGLAADVVAANLLAPLRVVRELTPLLRRGTDPVAVPVSSAAARLLTLTAGATIPVDGGRSL